MYKSTVEDLIKNETIEMLVRPIEGKDFVLHVKPDEKIANIKQEIWNNVGAKTQLNIGDAIYDFMHEYVESNDFSYDAFSSLSEEDQIKMLAKSGKFYQLFWKHYMLVFDNHIIEDEATVVGIGFGSKDEISIFPRQKLTKKENLFLQLFLGIKRKNTDVKTGVNAMHGIPYGLPVISKENTFHSHSNPEDKEQCEYELRLLETILMPTFDNLVNGDKKDLPEQLPNFTKIKTLLQMKYYEHSADCLKDLHDLIHVYNVNLNVHLNLCIPQDSEATKHEVEKRQVIYVSVTELLNKFETSITNVDETLSLFYSVYIGPGRSFTQYNYSLAIPSVQLSRINTATTVGQLIQSYKHYAGNEDLEISSLTYDGTQYLPYVVVNNIVNKNLQKHYFHFHHEIDEDGRDFEELLDFIGADNSLSSMLPSSSPTPSTSTPKIKKKRKKNKIPVIKKKEDSISVPEEASNLFPHCPNDVDGATSLPIEHEEKKNFNLEKSDTEKMSKIWNEYSDKNSAQKLILESSREYDFDITEEEGGPNDMSLEKAGYLDKLTNIIAAKAQAEWENKKIGFEKLQKENDDIQDQIKGKEKELNDHQVKVDAMIESKAKEMAKFIGLISQAEDDKEENIKEVGKLDMEIEELKKQIMKIKEEQNILEQKSKQCDEQIEKLEKKRKKLEKYMESEMIKVKSEGDIIKDEIDRLKDKLAENIKATEDLANSEIPKTEVVNPPKENASSRLLEFMICSIKEKENDLECPVCFETADVPIYMCSEMHLICSTCKPKVRECPECRVPYTGPPKRHRYAEKTAEELKKLRKEYENMTC